MLYPTIDDVQSLLNDYPVVPVFYEALADTFTPIHIFDALQQDEETCFILESVDNRSQWGRYSFIGVRPKMELRIENGTAVKITENGEEHTPFTDLAAFLSGVMKDYQSPSFPNKPKMTGGLIGYFSYDTVRYMEPTLKNVPEDDLKLPDCDLFLYDEIVAFDHLSNKTVVILNIRRGEDVKAQYQQCELRAKALVLKIKNYQPSFPKNPQSRHGGSLQFYQGAVYEDGGGGKKTHRGRGYFPDRTVPAVRDRKSAGRLFGLPAAAVVQSLPVPLLL